MADQNKPTPSNKDHSNITRNAELLAFGALVKKFDFDDWVEWMGKWGISRALVVSVLFLGLLFTLSRYVPNLPLFALEWLAGLAPIWLPIALGVAAWKTWKLYVLSLYLSNMKTIVLEMKVPREISRSPRAMELALTSLWTSSGETTFILRHWRGQVRPFYSFEIASFGGEVHFYIWCREQDKNAIETGLYAYYPEIELHEVEDYASKFRYDPEKYSCFATDHRLAPRSEAYPIKTYIDFELDKDPKDEFRVDPLASVLEYMSSLKPQEQAWVQIIITLNKDKWPGKGLFSTESRWEGMIKAEVKKIRRETALNPGKEDAPEDDPRKYGFPRPTWSEQEQMKAMERQLGKLPFDVGVRGIYIAEKKYFNGTSYNGVRWLWRPFANPGYQNLLRPAYWHNTLDFPWQDFNGYRFELLTRRFLDAYRRRSYFYSPWTTPSYMMSPEAIATLWHPPSRSIAAPGLERISATKAEPPHNLPR
ncbi:MAG: hypothetical protein KGI71_03350, partial [Patescibacteria group bacterium]|nr:hypothetical protein [Patescibacteria group bacterium]